MITTVETKTGQTGKAISHWYASDSEIPSPIRCVCDGQAGQWLLIVGPHSIRHMMMTVIAGLAEHEPVRVLDGGNQFDAYQIARFVRGSPTCLERIKVSRAFSCYQVLTLLENTPSVAEPFVVLDMLNTFYDESVKIWERKRLLRKCLDNLGRLQRYAGGAVSISPPRVRSKEATELFKMVEAAAKDTYQVELMIPSREMSRLF